jgi:hypothetical protein
MLRLAESLDRSHSQIVSGIDLEDRDEDALLVLKTAGDAELELWAASRHAAPFEGVIGKPLRIESIPSADADQHETPRRASGRTAAPDAGPDFAARAANGAPDLVERRGTPRASHRMELISPRQRRAASN